ncbi:MAG: hypothetical protein ACSLFF_09125 [Solirubrobacterales bacterium]
MSATTVDRSKAAHAEDLLPLIGGGFVIACVAIVVCALVNAVGVAFYESFTSEDALTWRPAVVVLFGVFAVAVSLVVGRWLFSLRRWIGLKDDPEDLELIHRKRRAFALGAMIPYVLLTPLVWVLVVAIANSAT